MADFHSLLILTGAVGLGAMHAFEVDHMTAISAFVAQRPTPREALAFGFKWAIGHGSTLLLFGTFLYLMKLTLSDPIAHGLERLVGLALLLLGCWTLMRLRAPELRHTHSHTHHHEAKLDTETNSAPDEAHEHVHADGTVHTHPHRHDSLLMGMLHGVAGTAAYMGESIVAVSQNYWSVFCFTFAFSFGVLLAMSAYGAVLGSVLSWGERRSTLLIHGVRICTGLWACGVGIYWMVR